MACGKVEIADSVKPCGCCGLLVMMFCEVRVYHLSQKPRKKNLDKW